MIPGISSQTELLELSPRNASTHLLSKINNCDNRYLEPDQGQTGAASCILKHWFVSQPDNSISAGINAGLLQCGSSVEWPLSWLNQKFQFKCSLDINQHNSNIREEISQLSPQPDTAVGR